MVKVERRWTYTLPASGNEAYHAVFDEVDLSFDFCGNVCPYVAVFGSLVAAQTWMSSNR